jgi:hypothetical protein
MGRFVFLNKIMVLFLAWLLTNRIGLVIFLATKETV